MSSTLYEVRWHGRGGQGVVTAAELLAWAAALEGKYGLAIPFFGAERRGAPVVAYNRISDRVIRRRDYVKRPDCVAVLDSSLFGIVDVLNGLKENGVVVVNAAGRVERVCSGSTYAVDATGIALELGLTLAGIPLVNMPMLGAVARATGLVSVETLVKAVFEKWGEKGARSADAVRAGYREVKVV